MTTFNSTSSIFGKQLTDDLYNAYNQTDNSTVFITPRYNTTGKIELKIGVLLPFTQKKDDLTAQIVWGGSSAIRMAVNEINNKQIIPGAYVTLIQKDSFPDASLDQMAVTNAVYASVTLLQQGVIGVIGDISSSWTSLSAIMTSTLEIPQCSYTANAIAFSDKSQYSHFFRTIPTQVIIADVMLSFVSTQGWKKLGVIYTDDPLGQQFYQKSLVQAKAMNINIMHFQALSTASTIDNINTALINITDSGARIIMVAATAVPQSQLLIQAHELGLLSNDYVWLMMGDTTKELKSSIDSYNKNHSKTIDYATDYQGLFLFDNWLSLEGYPPFEEFLDRWAMLDPNTYPYAGQRNISSYEGLAYSCMMVMAEGFGKKIAESRNQTDQLLKLVNGGLGEEMVPTSFNVGYVGPEGKMTYDLNGDLTTGNYLVYNLQQGHKAVIGKSTGGLLNMTSLPMFFDGTSQPPQDSPPSAALNPNIDSSISRVILAISSIGVLFATFCFLVVLLYRKHEVFKASSPLFCCLELVGFILTYFSVVTMIGIPTATTCIVTPATFTLGFVLVLGNMIAKNYRIYRIFNNIFITRNVITDSHVTKTVFSLVAVDVIILVIGLATTRPFPEKIEITSSSHYWMCEAQGGSKVVFLVLFVIYAAILLLFATFLAAKTRSAGTQYQRYRECKQMGFSVYNILLCAVIGFVVSVIPDTTFYTRYYFSVTVTLWATSFSMFIVFVPKLHDFFQHKITEELQNQMKKETTLDKKRKPLLSFLKSRTATHHLQDHHMEYGNELLSLDQILASSHPVLDEDDEDEEEEEGQEENDHQLRRRKASAVSAASTTHYKNGQGNLIEIHEGELPVRKAFRYFPFLSQWEMHHIMVFPWLNYFSHFSKDAKKGTVMSYSHATIYSTKLEDYVLKIHGQGWSDMYIQLPSLNSLHTWEQCFSQKKPEFLSAAPIQLKPPVPPIPSLQQMDMITHPHDMLASSMSQDHLLRRLSDQSEEVISNSNTAVMPMHAHIKS